MEGIGRLGLVQIDSTDPVSLAEFWCAVLGVTIEDVLGEPPHYVNLTGPRGSSGPTLAFQRVAEPKTLKNRLHLDVVVDDVVAATARIEELGGRRAASDDFSEYGYRWRVMADPEDNEFCLIWSPADEEDDGP
jgi:predicted enzyme related to lactoylglutathione lyase